MGNQFSQKQCHPSKRNQQQGKQQGKQRQPPPGGRWNVGYNVSSLCRALHRGDWTGAMALCDTLPELCKLWCWRPAFWDGRYDACLLPLHEAVSSGSSSVPLALVQTLIRHYPKALRKPESRYRRLPLHCACRSNSSSSSHASNQGLIPFLARHYPSACSTPDSLGRVPLHYAFSNGCSPQVIRALLQQAPEAAACPDENGWTPIHVALVAEQQQRQQQQRPHYQELIRQMLLQHSQVVWMKTKQGTTLMDCYTSTTTSTQDDLLHFLQQMEQHADATIKVPSLASKRGTLLLFEQEEEEKRNDDYDDDPYYGPQQGQQRQPHQPVSLLA